MYEQLLSYEPVRFDDCDVKAVSKKAYKWATKNGIMIRRMRRGADWCVFQRVELEPDEIQVFEDQQAIRRAVSKMREYLRRRPRG